jgi:hypothetical protein
VDSGRKRYYPDKVTRSKEHPKKRIRKRKANDPTQCIGKANITVELEEANNSKVPSSTQSIKEGTKAGGLAEFEKAISALP